MPVPTTISDLSPTAASNSPAGSDPIGTSADDYLRSIQAIVRQEHDDLASTASGKGAARVGYLHPAAGAVASTLKQVADDCFSLSMLLTEAQLADVQTRSATIDVTAAIQAAMTAGGHWYVPPGKYKVTGALALSSSAASPKTLVLHGSSTASEIAFSEGGSLRLSKSNYTTDYGLRDLLFSSDGNAATKVVFTVGGGDIKGCHFDGFDLALELNLAYQLIEHNVFTNCTDAIKNIDPDVVPGSFYNANAITHNLFADCGSGITLIESAPVGGAGPFAINPVVLAQNTFESCSVVGIKLSGAKNVIIDANYFELTPTNIDIDKKCRNIKVRVPTSHAGETTIKVDDSTVSLDGGICKNFVLTNNARLIENGPRDGALESVSVDATSVYVPWDADWAAPTLLNSWANTGAPYQASRYTLRSPGVVHIQGVVTGGAGGSVIFVLPFGFRPESRLSFPAVNILTAASTVIRVDPDGSVSQIAGSTTNIDLNISFSVSV